MKRVWKIALCLAGGLALNAGLRADDAGLTDNPYAAIVIRNVFGLNPPPPPVDPNAAPPAPDIKITPNGIMSITGEPALALFKTTGGGKPGEQSYMLGEGQAEDDIEVVKIDQEKSVITFNNHGVVQELPLANSAASGADTTGATHGGLTSVSGIPLPTFPPAGGANGASAFPPAASFGGPNNPGANFGGGPGSGANNGTSLPFGTTTHNDTAAQSQLTPMDPDVQQVLIVANHLKAIQDGDPVAQIYPVTDADAEAGIPSNIAPSTNSPSAPGP